jgi:hypothetical protein
VVVAVQAVVAAVVLVVLTSGDRDFCRPENCRLSSSTLDGSILLNSGDG